MSIGSIAISRAKPAPRRATAAANQPTLLRRTAQVARAVGASIAQLFQPDWTPVLQPPLESAADIALWAETFPTYRAGYRSAAQRCCRDY
jgi:hypothetical protein